MPAVRTTMRQVREVLRLKYAGVPTIDRFRAAGLSWPLPEDMTDAALEEQLFTHVGTKQGHRRHAEPDWAMIHREFKRKHVTLSILWDEYIERHPDGYRYSRFCELYRGWEAKLSVTMRQTHAGGDKLFVDYAGDTVAVIVDRLTGETRWRLELHLRRSHLDAGARRLDRRPYARLRCDRRGATFDRARQCQGRRHQSVSVRAAGKPHLRRDGGALRRRSNARKILDTTSPISSRNAGNVCHRC